MARTIIQQIQPGDKFGHWHILSATEKRGSRKQWLCRCSCEKQTKKAVDHYNLITGKSRSCGCLISQAPNRGGLSTDIVPGTKFGRLTIKEEAPRSNTAKRRWICTCSCGSAPVIISQSHLRTGHTQSCGCLKKEVTIARNTTHGLSHTLEYKRELIRKDPEKYNARCREYYARHKEEASVRHSRWCKTNQEKCHTHNAERRARKLQATPAWDKEKTREVFLELSRQARALYKETGVAYHIDHIVPLKGKNVSGLHVWNNFQLIPATDNMSKGCRI